MCKMWIEDDRKPLNPGDKIIVQGMCFRITGECGRGNSRIVYYAKDDKGRKVLIKELYPVGMGIKRKGEIRLDVPEEHLQAMKNFQNDADIELRNEDSTNNATVFTFLGGEYEGVYYYVSAYDAGMTLENWLEEYKDKPGYILSLLTICKKIAGILQAYHEKNNIHLDIKPGNILIKKDDSVLFFDFDSVYKIQDIKDRGVSFSPGYTAPEVQYPERWCDIDPDRTDIYSVGAILYEGIFGKIPGREVRQARYVPDYSSVDGLKKLSPALWPKLTEIFKHTLTNSILSRYNSADELCLALGEAGKIAEKDRFILDMDIRSELSNAIKRDAELSDIHKALTEQGKKVAYICGTGGTGKTELVLQYAEKYRTYYHTIQKVNYRKNLAATISAIEISTGKANIKSFCDIIDDNTLIIIDNLGTANGDSAVLKTLLEHSDKKVHFIITSRNSADCLEGIDRSLFKISTDNKPSVKLRKEITKIVLEAADQKGQPYHDKIIEFLESVNYHFLTAAVFSDALRVIPSTKYKDFFNDLKKRIFSPDMPFDKLRKIFSRMGFSSVRKYIMLNALLLSDDGMQEGNFLRLIGVEQKKYFCSNDDCDKLVKGSWLKRERRNGDNYIVMHPIIKEVCFNELWLRQKEGFDLDVFCKFVSSLNNCLSDRWTNSKDYSKNMKDTEDDIDVVNNLFELLSRSENSKMTVTLSETMRSELIDILSYYSYTNQYDECWQACETLLKTDSLTADESYSIYTHAANMYTLAAPYIFDYSQKFQQLEQRFQQLRETILSWIQKTVSWDFCNASDVVELWITLADCLYYEDKETSLSYAKLALLFIPQYCNATWKTAVNILRTGILCLNLKCEDEANICLELLDSMRSKDKEYEQLRGENASDFMMDMNHIPLICYCALKGSMFFFKDEFDQAIPYSIVSDFLLSDCVFGRYYRKGMTEEAEDIDEVSTDEQLTPIDIFSAMELRTYAVCSASDLLLLLRQNSVKVGDNEPSDLISEIIEDYCFERKDYIHAVQNIDAFDGLDPSDFSKEGIITAYEQEAEQYRQAGDEQKANFYAERADIIRKDFDNRRNMIADLLYPDTISE